MNIKLLSSVANTGGATVAAVVNINAAPVAFGSTSSLIAVDSSNVIAGTLTNGTLDNVETSTPPDEASLLPPGKYAVLLGPVSDHPGDYYLADGLAGSFELNGSNAVQRCRNIDDPSKPLVSSHEVGWGDLRNLLASALDTVGATSSSSSSGGG